MKSIFLVGVTAIVVASIAEVSSYAEFTKSVCEHNVKYLRCPRNTYIHIKSAEWGRRVGETECMNRKYMVWSRTEKTKVPGPELTPLKDCVDKKVTKDIRRACQKVRKCCVHAHNNLYGNPCSGIFKLLKIVYECQPRERIICEGQKAFASCLHGTKIRMTKAFYGRQNDQVCSEGGEPARLAKTCKGDILDSVSNKCNGWRNCKLKNSNGELGEKPCGDSVDTYAHVEWGCDEDPDSIVSSESATVCEHERAEIGCASGQIMRIRHAYWGRTDSATCSAGVEPELCADTSCIRNVHFEMMMACRNKQTCEIIASSESFHNPCEKTYKYLTVQWDCHNEKDPENVAANRG